MTSTDHVEPVGILPSIGAVGHAYDIGLTEAINGLCETARIRTTVFNHGRYKTMADAEYTTAGWVNRRHHARLHSGLGMVTPIEHERARYAALNSSAASPDAAGNPCRFCD